MRDILDLKLLQKTEMNNYIVISFIPILFGSLLFNFLFILIRSSNELQEGMNISELKKIAVLGFFQLEYFQYINIFLWLLYYLCFTVLLVGKSKLSLSRAIAISSLPSMIVLFLKEIFSLF